MNREIDIFDDTPTISSWPGMLGGMTFGEYTSQFMTFFDTPAPLTRDEAFENIANGKKTQGNKRKKRW